MTHNGGTTVRLPVNVLVAQVQDEGESAIQEAQDPHSDEELSRGGEVPLQVGHVHVRLIAISNVVWMTWEPDK